MTYDINDTHTHDNSVCSMPVDTVKSEAQYGLEAGDIEWQCALPKYDKNDIYVKRE